MMKNKREMAKKKPEADPMIQQLKDELWTHAMRGQWDKVINLYDNPEAQALEVMGSRETALHMAIADEQEHTVEKLVNKIVEIETLKKKNKLGDTALHLAAHLGSVRMCRSIVGRSAALLGERSKADETPLFVAARHGRKEAFVCMYGMCRDQAKSKEERDLLNDDYSREGKRTVLHVAISGEHFDLAYQIIHLYPKHITNRYDNWDFLPLHLLAKKPYVFKSGCPMGLLHRLVYFCIHVKKLEDETKSIKNKKENKSKNSTGGVQEKGDEENPPNSGREGQCPGLVPQNCGRRFRCLPLIISKAMGAILWLGSIQIENVTEQKKKHTWSVQIMNALLERSKGHSYPKPKKDAKEKNAQRSNNEPDIATGEGKDEVGTENKINKLIQLVEKMNGSSDRPVNIEDVKKNEKPVGQRNLLKESPLLMAAKNGILEMVETILEEHPAAIHDVNLDGKNVVLVSVKNRQPHIYQFLLDRKKLTSTIFYKTDKDNNSALHLAAVLSDQRNWNIPGPALHMQWEVKWYQFVEKSMPPRFFVLYNKKYDTPWYIFRDKHKELVVEAGKWLNTTSNSCSVVSILIATVAFTAYATVPGGLNSNTGRPVLERDAVFNLFAISSLIALCCSISSVVMFLVFFTSKYREIDFARNLPTKVLVELSSLMVAVAALLVSFCAAHSLVIKDSLKYTAFPLYAATLLPVAVYAFWQVPQYFEMAYATFHHTPQRIYPQ